MANILRETDPIVHSCLGQHSQQPNGELRDAACELMQVIINSDASTDELDSPELPRKQTLLELARKSRARNEHLSLLQLINLTFSENRQPLPWLSGKKSAEPAKEFSKVCSRPLLLRSDRISDNAVLLPLNSSFSSDISDDRAALLNGNNFVEMRDYSPKDSDCESEDDSWNMTDPRTQLISSV